MWFNIDLIILFLFLIANFIVGFGIRRKEADINDFKTYSLGNFKNPSVLFMTASFASSIISGSFFLVLIQQSYHTGIAYVLKNILFDPLSYAITAFFVLPLHKNTKNGGLTLNEWMDEKFHSSFLRAIMGLAEILVFFGFLVMQFKAFGTISKVMFNLPPQYEKLYTIIFAIFLSLYTFKGGFVSIVLTDILQFWVFAIAFVSLVVFVIFKTDFLSGVWSKSVIENPKMAISSCFKDYHAIIFALGIWVQTLYPKLNGARYQRMMMCNDAKKIKKSLLCSAGVVAFFTFFSICFGLLVYSKNPNLKIPEIIPFFINHYCPTGLKGLLGAGVFAMCISTAESILNSNAVVFTNDIIPAFYKIFSKNTYVPSVFVARLSTILLSCLGVYISFHMADIFSILMTFGNFYYPVAMIPAIVLVLGFNFKKASVMCGVLGGILATFINYVITKDLSSYFLGMMANLAGLLLTELFIRMKKKNEDTTAVEQAE